MAKKNYLVDIDLNNNELQNAVIHNVDILPTLTSANLVDVGKIIYLVPTSTAYILNNVEGVATWEPIGKGTASGGDGDPIFVTYSELKELADTYGLKIGQRYTITDYRTTHVIPGTQDINEGNIEPLTVMAILNNRLDPVARSLIHIEDIVYYNIKNNHSMVPGCTKGYIYRRIDTVRNNDIGMDWRNIKYRRWAVIVQNIWSPDYEYDLDTIVSYNNLIYVCVSTEGVWDDISNNFESTGIYNGEYVSLNSSGLNVYINNKLITIPAGSQYKDMTMFNDVNNIN